MHLIENLLQLSISFRTPAPPETEPLSDCTRAIALPAHLISTNFRFDEHERIIWRQSLIHTHTHCKCRVGPLDSLFSSVGPFAPRLNELSVCSSSLALPAGRSLDPARRSNLDPRGRVSVTEPPASNLFETVRLERQLIGRSGRSIGEIFSCPPCHCLPETTHLKAIISARLSRVGELNSTRFDSIRTEPNQIK